MEQSVKAGITTAVAAGLALVSAPASAAEWYVGLAGGETNVELEAGGADFEADDSAFKVFGGYMFNEFFGVELAYMDLGDLSDRVGFDGGEFGESFVDLDGEVSGFSAELAAEYPLGPVDLFAQAGIMAWDVEGDFRGFNGVTGEDIRLSADDDGEDLIWSVGARYNAGQFAVRAEYESIDAGDVDELTVMSIGVEYRFEI
jgi:OOP family OmpA-OmpF porin